MGACPLDDLETLDLDVKTLDLDLRKLDAVHSIVTNLG